MLFRSHPLLESAQNSEGSELRQIKQAMKNEKTKSVISEGAKDSLRKWLKSSYIFYEYFKVSKLVLIKYRCMLIIFYGDVLG